MSKLNILVIEPDNKPYLKTIKNELTEFQKIVGGNIEVAYDYEDRNIVYVINDENKINGSEFNKALIHNHKIFDYICGTFFICGDTGNDFKDISEADAEYYSKRYSQKEILVNCNGKLGVFRY